MHLFSALTLFSYVPQFIGNTSCDPGTDLFIYLVMCQDRRSAVKLMHFKGY